VLTSVYPAHGMAGVLGADATAAFAGPSTNHILVYDRKSIANVLLYNIPATETDKPRPRTCRFARPLRALIRAFI
jgi:hypothetical protein